MTLAVALRSDAATPAEFYLSMLQKGIAAHEAGRFDAAAGPLRIAAFGFVDSVPQYETAQMYLALSYDRLGDLESATQAARRLVTAERVEPRYALLPIGSATRTAFEGVARKVLPPADLAVLEGSGRAPAPQRTSQQPTVPPSPATTVAQVPVSKPAPTQPAPVQPQPQQQAPAQPRTGTAAATPAQTPATKSVPPAPAKTATVETKPAPAAQKPAPAESKPAPAKPAPAKPAPAHPTADLAARFAAGEQALRNGRLTDARTIFREIVELPSLDRAELLRAAEGLYRSRDFAATLRAFDRLGALRRGEEPYRYYLAVALYETGQYARAKQELTAVLPYIEVTPDVASYRTRIEGAIK